MGYKDKKYQRDLTQQINDRLTRMLHAGEGRSKKDDIANGESDRRIYSYATYQSYYKHCKYFAHWVKNRHPECKKLKKAKKYVNAWLKERVDKRNKNGEPLSAWTITLEREALGKLFGIKPDDPDFFQAPARHREYIKRSRGDAVRDKHFSEKNNDEFIKFCRGTGCRRNILKKLQGRDLFYREDLLRVRAELQAITDPTVSDLMHLDVIKDALEFFPDQEYFLHHRTDKGGRERFAPIIGPNADKIVERMRATAPNAKVWLNVPGNADVHGYRAEYATTIYKMYARPIEQIPYDEVNDGSGKPYQSKVYVCRKDEKGKKLDKKAMEIVSKALGHNRIEIVANNYLRGI